MPILTLTPSSTVRGFQYTNRIFRAKLDAAKMTQSMSRVGHCIDNGSMEGFWGILKYEMYYLSTFDTYEGLYSAMADYIDFYNNSRLQQKLNSLAPAGYLLPSSLHKKQNPISGILTNLFCFLVYLLDREPFRKIHP